MNTINFYKDYHHVNNYVKLSKLTLRLDSLKSEINNYNHKLFYEIDYFKLKQLHTDLLKAKNQLLLTIKRHEQISFPFGS